MKTNAIAKEVATLMGGNMLAQLITVAAYFVLTRIYSPSDYGLFNIFYSYIEVLVIASTCKYELAVVVAADEREAAAVSRFALRLNTWVSVSLLAVVTVLWAGGWLPTRFERLGWMVMLIPPMVFFCGTSRIYSFLYNRYHRYKHIALSDNVAAGGGALMKILLGVGGALQSGLPVGTVLGQAASNVNYRVGLRKMALPATTRAERHAAARRHRNFPLYVASKEWINTFSANLPFLWAAQYFDDTMVGLYGLALTFTLQPVNILGSAMERVLYARTAEAVRQRRPIKTMLMRTLMPLAVAAVVMCVVVWFVAEPLFVFFFGSRWSGCGVYVQALLPLALTGFMVATTLYLPNVFGTQRREICFFVGLLVVRVVAVYIGIRTVSFVLTIRIFALASAAVYVAILLWYASQVRRYEVGLKA